jgi:hypothetical protein
VPTVTVSKVASALNLDVRRVQQLVQAGMPREARGQYDVVKCMLVYIRYLQNILERKAMPTLEVSSASAKCACDCSVPRPISAKWNCRSSAASSWRFRTLRRP